MLEKLFKIFLNISLIVIWSVNGSPFERRIYNRPGISYNGDDQLYFPNDLTLPFSSPSLEELQRLEGKKIALVKKPSNTMIIFDESDIEPLAPEPMFAPRIASIPTRKPSRNQLTTTTVSSIIAKASSSSIPVIARWPPMAPIPQEEKDTDNILFLTSPKPPKKSKVTFTPPATTVTVTSPAVRTTTLKPLMSSTKKVSSNSKITDKIVPITVTTPLPEEEEGDSDETMLEGSFYIPFKTRNNNQQNRRLHDRIIFAG